VSCSNLTIPCVQPIRANVITNCRTAIFEIKYDVVLFTCESSTDWCRELFTNCRWMQSFSKVFKKNWKEKGSLLWRNDDVL
jgi:hypothetical protein